MQAGCRVEYTWDASRKWSEVHSRCKQEVEWSTHGMQTGSRVEYTWDTSRKWSEVHSRCKQEVEWSTHGMQAGSGVEYTWDASRKWSGVHTVGYLQEAYIASQPTTDPSIRTKWMPQVLLWWRSKHGIGRRSRPGLISWWQPRSPPHTLPTQ